MTIPTFFFIYFAEHFLNAWEDQGEVKGNINCEELVIQCSFHWEPVRQCLFWCLVDDLKPRNSFLNKKCPLIILKGQVYRLQCRNPGCPSCPCSWRWVTGGCADRPVVFRVRNTSRGIHVDVPLLCLALGKHNISYSS